MSGRVPRAQKGVETRLDAILRAPNEREADRDASLGV